MLLNDRRRFWLRTAMHAAAAGSLTLNACGGRDEAALHPVSAVVTLDATRRYQTMTGWEVASQGGQEEASSYHIYRDSLLDLAANDLGVTRVRLWVRSGFENSTDIWAEHRAGRHPEFRCSRYTTVNDNDDPFVIDTAGFHFSQLDYTIETFVLPLKRRVEARGDKFHINANYVAFMKQCGAGARYDHTAPDEYAEFVLATYLHLRDKYGLVPDTWEVILEPENTYYWRGRQIGEAMVAAARLLDKHGFKARFVAPSTTKAANAPRYFDELIAVPGALQYLEELSYHRYRGYNNADITTIGERGKRYHVNTAMLEHIGADYEELHQDLKVAGISAWQQFALAFPAKDDDGAQYYLIKRASSNTPQVRLAERTRYLRQYLRYIRPGAVRIEAASDQPAVDAVAFVGPARRHVVVLKCARAARISVSGLPAARYSAHYTTAKATDVSAGVAVQGRTVLVTMPARGVMTLFSD